jgi:DNA polymerase-1
LFAAIHMGAPFMRATMDSTMQEAQRIGYITTIMGRRSRFDLWVPSAWTDDETKKRPLPYEQAVRWYVNPQRAYLHKALNRRLQGSAADIIKKAMLQCWQDGVFDVTGVPRLTVHDELDFSDPGGKEEAFREMKHIMETAITLRVPILVEEERGPNWGEVKKLAA